jgi:Glycosyl transferase family 11
MVILTKNFDGFGNQLLISSHFMVNALEHGYELAIPSFRAHFPFFEGTADKQVALFGGRPVYLHRGNAITAALYRTLQWHWGAALLRHLPWLPRSLDAPILDDSGPDDVDLNSPAYLSQVREARDLLINGWQFRDKPNFTRHGDLLRQFFRPIAPHRLAVEQVLATNRAAADVLIGVHIRRGDYAGWYGGAFLYPNATYARAMREMRGLFPTTTRVRFLLFSNEPITAEDFVEFDTGRSTNHPVEDLYAMAGCDYLIGPLSTYSMWASFYGRVPLLHLHRPDQPVKSLTAFQVFEDQEAAQWAPALL